MLIITFDHGHTYLSTHKSVVCPGISDCDVRHFQNMFLYQPGHGVQNQWLFFAGSPYGVKCWCEIKLQQK